MKHFLILLLVANIWGFAFVAQKAGMQYIGPFAFNGIRFLLGVICLIPILFFKIIKTNYKRKNNYNITIKSGIILGFVLFIAAAFQQVGIIKSTAGNAGFITSLYIIIVPFFGIFLKQKVTKEVWSGAILALIGLYFLSINYQFQMAPGDGLILISSIFWALHIILIGHYAPKTNVLLLSIIQFFVSAILNLSIATIFEVIHLSMIHKALYPILYGGIMSIGVAYTLQAIGQRKVTASKAAIILSLESVFAMLGGIIILKEILTIRKGTGALIMLIGLIISQIKIKCFTPKSSKKVNKINSKMNENN
jgi:drug/metabolite transporter (DMT)-like permease